MDDQTWECIDCGWQVIDNDGEAGVDGLIEEDGKTYADTPCVRCGGRLLLVEEVPNA